MEITLPDIQTNPGDADDAVWLLLDLADSQIDFPAGISGPNSFITAEGLSGQYAPQG
jgi:hypothetical protein